MTTELTPIELRMTNLMVELENLMGEAMTIEGSVLPLTQLEKETMIERKIEAIKMVRQRTGCRLVMAKDSVERAIENLPDNFWRDKYFDAKEQIELRDKDRKQTVDEMNNLRHSVRKHIYDALDRIKMMHDIINDEEPTCPTWAKTHLEHIERVLTGLESNASQPWNGGAY